MRLTWCIVTIEKEHLPVVAIQEIEQTALIVSIYSLASSTDDNPWGTMCLLVKFSCLAHQGVIIHADFGETGGAL